ncbi:MAG: helix-turn-helix domain-containing protein [Terracidiphilus sp.]|jgi:putative transcriptional regulator
MSRRIADGILRGLQEALAIANGTAKEGTYVVHIPPEIDIKAIRGRLGMTQQEFAERFDFNINTLRHWEQGRRVPDGTARAYLRVIDREPEAVQKALRVA